DRAEERIRELEHELAEAQEREGRRLQQLLEVTREKGLLAMESQEVKLALDEAKQALADQSNDRERTQWLESMVTNTRIEKEAAERQLQELQRQSTLEIQDLQQQLAETGQRGALELEVKLVSCPNCDGLPLSNHLL
ncbi:hypothetical protein Ciccas_010916, partial [Cichlidogyrus casuarinus]